MGNYFAPSISSSSVACNVRRCLCASFLSMALWRLEITIVECSSGLYGILSYLYLYISKICNKDIAKFASVFVKIIPIFRIIFQIKVILFHKLASFGAQFSSLFENVCYLLGLFLLGHSNSFLMSCYYPRSISKSKYLVNTFMHRRIGYRLAVESPETNSRIYGGAI